MNTQASEQKRKNLLERFLSLFSDIKSGEGHTVLILFLNAFLMMGLYYMLKPIREGLIISGFGAVIKSYSAAAQAVLFAFVVPLYGAFAARVNRVWLLSGMTLFFISNLILFAMALGAGLNIGVVYYIWLGIFNFMIPSQFWAFANDVYTQEQGKRLFPIIGIGASSGALAGAWVTAGVLTEMTNVAMMILAGALLGLFILLIVWIHRREGSKPGAPADQAGQKLSKEGGFQLVMRSRYLLLVAFHVLILNLVNTVGGFILDLLFEQAGDEAVAAGTITAAEESAYLRTLYSELFGWVNLLGLLIQSFLVSRLIKYLGVRGSLFIGPIISLVTYGTTAFKPVLRVVRGVKILENANDYSTNNTVRQALFLPTSRDVKYKAKAAIDTFFARTGDALQAVAVFAGTRLAFAIPAFAIVNVVFIGIWLLVCGGIAREHKKLTDEG
jgi:AAA family ATP:ADP antiporter